MKVDDPAMPDVIGVPTFLPRRSPAKVPALSWTGLSGSGRPIGRGRRKAEIEPFSRNTWPKQASREDVEVLEQTDSQA